MSDNAYLDTLDRMEPDIAHIDASAGWASIAVSLKRIADSLERLADLQAEQMCATKRSVDPASPAGEFLEKFGKSGRFK